MLMFILLSVTVTVVVVVVALVVLPVCNAINVWSNEAVSQ